MLEPHGVLLCSTNAARLPPEDFEKAVRGAVRKTGRRVEAAQYAPQGPDFAVGNSEEPYLKTLWLRVA